MAYEWDNKKPTAQMLGRWQPFHDGHYTLFKEIIKKTGQVCIQIRDVQGVDDNPFDFETVKKNIEDRLNPEFEGQFKIMLVPNITNICYGRGVGYKIEEIVSRSIELKASVVTEDEHEHGKREILNFGHTFGHAMEVAQHYTMSHGTAVGRGMLLEIRLGIELGLTDPSTFEATVSCLAKLGISNHGSQDLNSEEIMDHLRLDKKSKLGGRRFVLISGIGSVLRNGEDWSHTIEEGILMEFLGSL